MPQTPKATPEQLERIGALAAELVRPHDRLGLGSGQAALAFVRMLGRRVQNERLPLTGVATSLLTEQVARQHAVPLATLEQVETLDLAVNGADEVDPHLNLTKGGGGNLTREKVVAGIAHKLVIVVGQEKIVDHLGTNFPVFVEVIEFARPAVVRQLQALGASVTQRRNPDGSPFLTDNGNPYLHCQFALAALAEPEKLELALRIMPGVVETGLFIGMAHEIIIARFDGTVARKSRT